MIPDYDLKKTKFCIGLILLGTLMLLGGLIGYFFSKPVGLLSVITVVFVAVAIIGCGGVLISLAELVNEWIKKSTELTPMMLLRGYKLAMIGGFVAGSAMLFVFLFTQELKGASTAEFVTPAVAAIGGLLTGLGALNILFRKPGKDEERSKREA